MKVLKQSTSTVIHFGPFVDKTDGVTFQTDLVGTGANQLEHTSSGILIGKNGGTMAARSATATASAYDAYGMYKVTLSTTDTGTCGRLLIAFGNAADVLPVWVEYTVVPANVYESLVLGVEWLEVTSLANRVAVSGTTVTIYKQDDTTSQFTNTGTFVTGADVLTQLAGKP
jgi:hypothetical protein